MPISFITFDWKMAHVTSKKHRFTHFSNAVCMANSLKYLALEGTLISSMGCVSRY